MLSCKKNRVTVVQPSPDDLIQIIYTPLVKEEKMSMGKKHFPHFMVIILVFTLGACGSQTSETPVVTPPAISVTITNENCPSLEVQPGMQVAWTNAGDEVHIVQSELLIDGSRKFDSGELQPGDNFVFTFTEPGSYAYQCSADGTMKGTVTVNP